MKEKRRTKKQKETDIVLTDIHRRIEKMEEKFTLNRQIEDEAEIEVLEEQQRNCGIECAEENSYETSLAKNSKGRIVVPKWDELYEKAKQRVGDKCDLDSLFSPKELEEGEIYLNQLNEDFRQIHKLDKMDICICAIAGIIGAAVNVLLVGIPQRGKDGLEAGPLANYIRRGFERVFPEDEMRKLANSKNSKVPYDAQDNRNTTEYVVGLSAYYHRLLSLGHDPLLGFIVGIFDIITGRMTTIDKEGKIVSQVMENYEDRKETDIFSALVKQLIHFKSDITTSMGLPAPAMAFFNLFQFGSIGEEDQTVAEIVQGMYYEGYDFIHFCSQSIPTMIVELIVRVSYSIKRIKEGYKIIDSIPVSIDRKKHPKLSTMLFISHSGATAINAGSVWFSKNPLSIDYPQWVMFAKYSYNQLKWSITGKSEERKKYIRQRLDEDWDNIMELINKSYDESAKGFTIVL